MLSEYERRELAVMDLTQRLEALKAACDRAKKEDAERNIQAFKEREAKRKEDQRIAEEKEKQEAKAALEHKIAEENRAKRKTINCLLKG